MASLGPDLPSCLSLNSSLPNPINLRFKKSSGSKILIRSSSWPLTQQHLCLASPFYQNTLMVSAWTNALSVTFLSSQSPFLLIFPTTTAISSTSINRKKAEDMLQFMLEKDRYRFYAAYSCPFAHRVRLVRLLKSDLEDALALTFVTGQTAEEGFIFDEPEPEFGCSSLQDVYHKTNPKYEGRYTVPMIVDKTTHKMVDNESMDSAIALATQSADTALSLVPTGAEDLARHISDHVTTAAYKYLFVPDPHAKLDIAAALWAEFDKYNALLETQTYLMGDTLSIPDCVLWASLIRYDNVYARQFGIQGKIIRQDYPHLARYIERIWKMPSNTKMGVTLGEDANLPEVIRSYWQSGNLAPKAGNDPTSPVPAELPVF